MWMRADSPAQVSLRYGTDADPVSCTESSQAAAAESREYTTNITLWEPGPLTVCYVDALVKDVPQCAAPCPRFKPLALNGEVTRFTHTMCAHIAHLSLVATGI